MNNYQYVKCTAKNDSFYEVKAQTELAPPEPSYKDHSFEVIHVYHVDAPSQAKYWPLQTNTTGLLYIFHRFFIFRNVS
jgi:hypothetical protein